MKLKWMHYILAIGVVVIILTGTVIALAIPVISQNPNPYPLVKSSLIETPNQIIPQSTQLLSNKSSNQNAVTSTDETGSVDFSIEDPKKILSDVTAIKVSDVTIDEIGADYSNAQWVSVGGVAGVVYEGDVSSLSGFTHTYRGLTVGLKPGVTEIWVSITIPVSASRNVRYIRIISDTGKTSPFCEIDNIVVHNGDKMIGYYDTSSWVFGGVRIHTLDLKKWVKFTRGINISMIISNKSGTAYKYIIINGVGAKEEW